MIRRALVGVALSVLPAGCAPSPPPVAIGATGTAHRVTFLCEHGQNIVVTFQGNGAMLERDGASVRLSAQPVASGIHYAGAGHDLRGKGHEATWTDPSGVARDCRDQEWAMKQPQIQEPAVQLAGSAWRLVHFQSSDDAIGTVIPPRVERYTLNFGADGALALRLDCNRGMAQWSAEPSSRNGGALTIKAGAMTRAMCGADAIDTRLARDLAFVRSYTLAGGRLHLALQADAGSYVWEPLTDGAR
jgi:heat shock protein HslJ